MAGHSLVFQSGAYVFGANMGLLTHTQDYPWLTMLLASVISMLCPGHCFSSLSLCHNVRAPVHRDSHNHHRVPNVVLPVSHFRDGGLWIEQPDIPGVFLPIRPPYLLFDSRKLYSTQQWRGERSVLIAYHVRDAWRMSAAQEMRLRRLGFAFWTGDAVEDPYLLE